MFRAHLASLAVIKAIDMFQLITTCYWGLNKRYSENSAAELQTPLLALLYTGGWMPALLTYLLLTDTVSASTLTDELCKTSKMLTSDCVAIKSQFLNSTATSESTPYFDKGSDASISLLGSVNMEATFSTMA